MDYQAIIDEINAIGEEMVSITKLLDQREAERNRLFAQAEEALREEYERGEVESAQSIDHQRGLGNYKAGM